MASTAKIGFDTFNPNHLTKYFTKNLALACGLVSISTFNYAFDQQGFNSTQAMTAFAREFGVCNKRGKCALEPYYLSLLNSLVYVGFAIGGILVPYFWNLFILCSCSGA